MSPIVSQLNSSKVVNTVMLVLYCVVLINAWMNAFYDILTNIQMRNFWKCTNFARLLFCQIKSNLFWRQWVQTSAKAVNVFTSVKRYLFAYSEVDISRYMWLSYINHLVYFYHSFTPLISPEMVPCCCVDLWQISTAASQQSETCSSAYQVDWFSDGRDLLRSTEDAVVCSGQQQ